MKIHTIFLYNIKQYILLYNLLYHKINLILLYYYNNNIIFLYIYFIHLLNNYL